MRNVLLTCVPCVCLLVTGCGSQPPVSPSGDGQGGGGSSSSSSGAGSSATKQLAAIHALEEAFEARDAKKYSALLTDDATVNVAGRPDAHGRAAAEQGFGRVATTFGKVRFHARRVFTKGDVAIVEWTMTGTHEGALNGIEPTHKPVGVQGAEVDRFAADGRIRERHVYFDQATVLGQIGKPAGDGVRPVPDDGGGAALQHVAATGSKDEDANMATLDKINRAWESRDESKWTALLADDVEWDDFAMTRPSKGKDAVRAYFKIFATAFPEVTASTINAWGVGSYVIEEGSFTGVQKGQYLNVPPSSALAVLYELNIVEMAGGKVKKGWTYSNELDLREQLGAKAKPDTAAKPPAKKK